MLASTNPPPMPSRTLARPLMLVVTLSVILLAGPFSPAGAQTVEENPATTSPVAVPFIGSYEIWCTSFNPAPGDRCRNHHTTPAIDFGMEVGTPIRAAGDGIVEEIETSCSGPGWCRNGAGNFISIAHADGRFSRYLHLTDVFVEEGQIITVGDLIGTSGETGQSSSPHLHYDEHFPRGTRSPMGEWLGCVDGQIVRYPDVFGETDWNDVPYGSIVRNDGYDCLTGVPAEQTSPPIVISGDSIFGITIEGLGSYDVEITMANDSTTTLVLSGGTLITQPAPDEAVSVRLRDRSAAAVRTWSEPVVYDPMIIPSGPLCRGLHASSGLIGTTAADVIIGTDGPDVIDGRGGNDIICAGAGNDSIHGGRGSDFIRAGDGDDFVSGGFGRDEVRGGNGDDDIRGGNGPDVLWGGPGTDSIHGTAGNDTIDGGPDNDLVIGGIGHDVLRGGSGDDRIEGRNGRDYLGGGGGNDALFGGNGLDRLVGAAGDDTFDGGPRSDRCATDDEDTGVLVECER